MPKSLISDEIAELRTHYDSNAHSKTILDDFASRTNNQRITKVDQIQNRLSSTGLPRWAIIALFRKLDELKFGRFIEGRKGHPSRFVWSANQTEVGKAAQGGTGQVTSIAVADQGESSLEELRTYQFPLRTGTDATLELPADLTEKEAERLGLFIKTLARSAD